MLNVNNKKGKLRICVYDYDEEDTNNRSTFRIGDIIYPNYTITFTGLEISCLIEENDHDTEYEIYQMKNIIKTFSKTIYMDKNDYGHLYYKYTVKPLNNITFDFSIYDDSNELDVKVNVEDSPEMSDSYFCSMDEKMNVRELYNEPYRMFFTNTFKLLIDEDEEEVLYYKKM